MDKSSLKRFTKMERQMSQQVIQDIKKNLKLSALLSQEDEEPYNIFKGAHGQYFSKKDTSEPLMGLNPPSNINSGDVSERSEKLQDDYYMRTIKKDSNVSRSNSRMVQQHQIVASTLSDDSVEPVADDDFSDSGTENIITSFNNTIPISQPLETGKRVTSLSLPMVQVEDQAKPGFTSERVGIKPSMDMFSHPATVIEEINDSKINLSDENWHQAQESSETTRTAASSRYRRSERNKGEVLTINADHCAKIQRYFLFCMCILLLIILLSVEGRTQSMTMQIQGMQNVLNDQKLTIMKQQWQVDQLKQQNKQHGKRSSPSTTTTTKTFTNEDLTSNKIIQQLMQRIEVLEKGFKKQQKFQNDLEKEIEHESDRFDDKKYEI